MKKQSIFAIAIAALAFTSCGGGNSNIEKNASSADDKTTTSAQTINAAKGDIVFVRIDSVIDNYDMYVDLNKAYEEEATKADTDLRTKANAFERDYRSLAEKAEKHLMTQSEIQAESEKLQRRQQSLQEEQNKKRNELGEKQMVMLNKINDAINTFINEYNKTKGYSLIISTSGNQPVLYGNPGLDITSEVITGLNEAYKNSK